MTAKKLIEVALPLPEINDASAYDKMPGIGPHPKGIHHWWARLPLPTARAVFFASVVDDPESNPTKWDTEEQQNAERERLFDIVRRLMGKKLHEAPEVYAQARGEMLKHCGGVLPAVYDPFAGGGSIPLEANRMGFDAYAGDLNPVAVLLNKCNLEIVPHWHDHPPVNPSDRKRIGGNEAWRGSDGLAADIRYYGRRIFEKAVGKIGDFYPKATISGGKKGAEAPVIAWLLANAMGEGIKLLTWSKDSFAYADSFDDKEVRYRGLRCGQLVTISASEPTGLLVKPDVATKQQEAERPPAGPSPTGGTPPGGGPVPGGTLGAPAPQSPKRFHGSVKLDATRVGRDAGRIADEVISHLTALVGAEVKVTLEIEAQVPTGVPEKTVRTVTENSRTLKFDTQGFEEG